MRALTPPVGLLVRLLASMVSLVAVVITLSDLHGGQQESLALAVLTVMIVVGELVPVLLFDRHATAPLSTAAALALCLLPVLDVHGPVGPGTVDVLAWVATAMAVGALASKALGQKIAVTALCARYLGVAVVIVLYRATDWFGLTAVEWVLEPGLGEWAVALWMLLPSLAGLCIVQASIEGLLRAQHDQSPVLRTMVDEVRSGFGLSTALVSSGVMVAIAEPSLGAAAVPLFLAPLLFTQLAVVRYGTIRRTYTETIRTLSTLTDLSGYTTPGHADRVSSLAVQMARILGLSARDVVAVEYASLLHDLGQVALREPIPGGATVLAAPVDQRRIAHDGADIVRETGVLDGVAVVLEAQTTPYRQVREFGEPLPMASRIVKVANAFDDFAGPSPSRATVDRALERISLGLGYEYDPKVVDALNRSLERRRGTTG